MMPMLLITGSAVKMDDSDGDGWGSLLWPKYTGLIHNAKKGKEKKRRRRAESLKHRRYLQWLLFFDLATVFFFGVVRDTDCSKTPPPSLESPFFPALLLFLCDTGKMRHLACVQRKLFHALAGHF